MSKKISSISPSFWLVSIFAILRGILYYNLFLGRKVFFYSDDAVYAILARRLLEGDFLGGFHPYWNPGFPLATIPFYLVSGKWESAQILTSMTASVLLIFVLYFTLKNISKPLALLAAFVVAFSPALERLTVFWGTTEPLYVLLFWLAIYFGWRAIKSKTLRHYALTGLFFGLAYLTRTEVIFTMGLFLAIALLLMASQKRKKNSLNKTAFIFFAAGLGISVYYSLSGAIRFFSKYKTFSELPLRPPSSIIAFSLLLLVFAALAVIFERNKQKLRDIARFAFPRIGILLAVFLLVNLPYITAISIQLGKPTLSGKYAYLGSGPPFSPEPRRFSSYAQDIWSIDFPNYNSPYYESPRAFLALWKARDSAVDSTWKMMRERIGYYGSDNLFSTPIARLMFLGFIAAMLQTQFAPFAVYLAIIWLGSFIWVSFALESAFRYLAFSFPILFTGLAFAVLSLGRLLAKVKPVLLPVSLAVFMLLFFQENVDKEAFTQVVKTGGSSDQKMLGDWLKENDIKLFMGRTEAIGFYANAKMVYVPFATPDTIVNWARAWGVEYIVSRPAESSWDYMKEIVNPDFQHPKLTLVKEFPDGTLIWKVRLTEEEKTNNLRTGKHVFRELEEN